MKVWSMLRAGHFKTWEGAKMKTLLLAAIIALAGCSTTTRIGDGECVVFKDSWFSSERTVIGHGC